MADNKVKSAEEYLQDLQIVASQVDVRHPQKKEFDHFVGLKKKNIALIERYLMFFPGANFRSISIKGQSFFIEKIVKSIIIDGIEETLAIFRS